MKKITFLFVAIQILSASGYAALGDKIASVEKDRKNLNLTAGKTQSTDSFKYVEATSKDFTVRQFVANNGSVFGVAWNGIAKTQLKQLLGSYYSDFQKADSQNPQQQALVHYRKVVGDDVVVEQWNDMRRVWGRTYSPSLLPSNVGASRINMR